MVLEFDSLTKYQSYKLHKLVGTNITGTPWIHYEDENWWTYMR